MIKELTCIRCPIGCKLKIDDHKVTGNKCPRGKEYAIEEMTAPKRIVTSTVKIIGGTNPVISVKTAQPIPKEKIFEVMRVLAKIELKAPVRIGDIIVKNVAATGIDIIATKDSNA